MSQNVYTLLHGTIGEQLKEAQWDVRPLLRRRRDRDQNTISLAWLIHEQDNRTRALLKILGFEQDNTVAVDHRHVYFMPGMVPPTNWTMPDVSNDSFSSTNGWMFGADAIDIPNAGAGYFQRQGAEFAIGVDNNGAFSQLALTIPLKIAKAGGFEFPTEPFTVTLKYIVGQDLHFGNALLSGEESGRWPAEPNGSLALVAEASANGGTQTVYLEQTVGQSNYTHRPIAAIPEAKVTFTWDEVRIRYGVRDVGVYLPPESQTKIGRLSLHLLLVMSKVTDPTSNAVSRLLPTTSQQATGSSSLDFNLEILRPDNWENKPLLSFPVRENTLDEGDRGNLADLQHGGAKPGEEKNWSLDSLFGDLTAWVKDSAAQVQFYITVGTAVFEQAKATLGDLCLPVTLELKAGSQTLTFLMAVPLDLWNGRLRSNRLYFYCWGDEATQPHQWFDLNAFAIKLPTFPARTNPPCPSESGNYDGYLDLETNDLVLSFNRKPPSPDIELYFPGGFLEPQLPEADELAKRTLLQLDQFHPETWPNDEKATDVTNKLLLRLGARGLSLYAKVKRPSTAHLVQEAQGAKNISLHLVQERKGIASEIVVINNQVRHASLFGHMAVPGFQNLDAEVELALRQEQPQTPPRVIAALSLEHSDQAPLAKLQTPYLQMEAQRLDLGLTWKNRDWELKAAVSGLLSLSPEVTKDGGLKDLKKPQAIRVRRLNLINLFSKETEIGFDLEQPASFDLMDGMFTVMLDDFTLAPKMGLGMVSTKRAAFRFRSSSSLDVAIEASSLQIELIKGNPFGVKLKTPAGIGIDARLGEGVRFRGEVQWVDNDVERYFAASGALTIDGFPEIAATLKIGTGVKLNGKTVPNIVIYGQFAHEAELFAGVVMKNIGVGMGINNRLRGISAQPDAYEILRNVDQIKPAALSGWTFVRENGLYVSLVASTMLASNRGGDKTINAYLAQMVLSLDTNLDVVAAGKMWLFSSLKFIRQADNWQRPAARGAMALRTRRKTMTLVAETGKRPAIEGNDALADLLEGVTARFSFFLSPDLVDYYLEEISYRRQFLGADFRFSGTYRIAIGRFGMLLRAGLTISGNFPRKKFDTAVGGFEFDGKAKLDVRFGGLISGRGAALYGTVDASATFNGTAYIMVPGIAWELRRFTLSFSLTWWEPHCKKWRCKMVQRSRTWTEELSMHVPVPVMNRHDLPCQSLDLQIRGGIAINERGNVGFRGTVCIKARFMGCKLDITGSLTFQEKVITNVRDRVAAVESQLNKLRGINPPPRSAAAPRAPAGTSASFALPLSPAPGAERWLYFKRVAGERAYHLLLPHPNSRWFTPRHASLKDYARVPRDTSLTEGENAPSAEERQHVSPFRKMVTSMRWEHSDGTAVEMFMPWDRRNMDAIDKGLDVNQRVELLLALGEIEAALLGTAISEDPNDASQGLEEGDLKQGDLRDFEIVFDPRLESGARVYWTTRDRFELPDHALPYDFRPVEELVAEGFASAGRAGDLDRLLLYEHLRAHAARVSQHAAVDRGAAEELRQARAAVVYGIIEDFQRLGGPQKYGEIADLKLGGNDDPNLRVTPHRRGAPAVVKTNTDFELTKELLETLTSLEFDEEAVGPWEVKVNWGDSREPEPQKLTMRSVETKSTQEQTASHKFTIPSRYEIEIPSIDPKPKGFPSDWNPTFMVEAVENEEGAAAWQAGLIYETNWDAEPKVQIFRDGKPVWAMIEKFDNAAEEIQSRVRCLPIRQKFLSAVEIERARAGDGVVQVRLPLKLHEDLLKNYLPFLNAFRIYRQFPWEPAPVLVGDHVWPQLEEIEEGGRNYLFCDGFLFTDRFDVRAGAFDAERYPALRSDITEVRYFLEAVPYGYGDSDEKPNLLAWPPVRLHIPARPEPLPAVALLLPVNAILEPEQSGNEEDTRDVRFIRADGSPLAINPEMPVEIWAEALPLRQSGFFGGDDLDLARADQEDAQVRRPSELTVEELLHNAQGKFKVGELTIGAAADPHLDMRQFQPGFSYRLYIRPAVNSSQPLLRRLPLFLTRALPPREASATALRPIEQLEVISVAERDRILTPTLRTTWLEGRQFDWTPLEHNRLRFGWDTVSALDGGVEIVIQDQDETHLVWRQLNEVMEEQVFQASERDFRNASQWRLHPDQAKSPASVRINSTDIDAAQIPNYFLLGAEGSALRKQLDEDANGAIGALDIFEGNEGNAKAVFPLVQLAKWFATLFAYKRSSLYLGGDMEDDIQRMVACARALVLGLKLPGVEPGTAPTVAQYEAQEETLQALLRAVAEADPRQETIRDDQAEIERIKKLLNDYDTAERLARIAQRRMAVADELLLPQGHLEEMPGWDDSGRLPRADEWIRLVKQFQLAPDDYPLTRQLLEVFDPVLDKQFDKRKPDNANPVLLSDYGKLTAEKLREIIGQFKGKFNAVDRLAGIVTKGAGLTAALDALERDLGTRGCTLLRRPHHRIVVTEDGAGGGHKAVETMLASLLPDWARLPGEEKQVSQEPPEDLSGSVLFYGNLLERMGFALDIAVADELNRLWSQQELLELLNQISWDAALKPAIPDNLPGYDVFLICGREPDAAGPQTKASAGDVGYAFVKLAVVPKAFQDALVGNGYGEPVTVLDSRIDGDNVVLTLDRQLNPPIGDSLKFSFSISDVVLSAAINGKEIEVEGDQRFAEDFKGKQGEVRLSNADALSRMVKAWLGIRSITPSTERELSVSGHLAHYLLGRMVRDNDGNRAVYVEPRGERWQIVPALGGRSHSAWTPADLRGHRYRVGMRRVSRYEPLLRWYDRASVPTVQAAPDRHQEVSIRPILAHAEMQVEVPVLVRQHPTEAQFIYQLPAVGSRALVNGISAVRSGFGGLELAFQYELVDLESLCELLSPRAKSNDLRLKTDFYVETLPHPPATPPRLLRHERLVALPELPFYYHYGLDVQAFFDAAQPDAEQTGDVANSSSQGARALRQPAHLGVHQPLLKKGDNEFEFTLTLFLSRYGDHLSQAELAHDQYPLRLVELDDGPIRPWELPDLAMGYELLCLLDPELSPENEKIIARTILRVTLPWHERFIKPDNYDATSCLAAVEPGPTVTIKVSTSDFLLDNDNAAPIYRVVIDFTVTGADGDPEAYRLQASRNGFSSRLYKAATFD